MTCNEILWAMKLDLFEGNDHCKTELNFSRAFSYCRISQITRSNTLLKVLFGIRLYLYANIDWNYQVFIALYSLNFN